jgi:hypothetical protein
MKTEELKRWRCAERQDLAAADGFTEFAAWCAMRD